MTQEEYDRRLAELKVGDYINVPSRDGGYEVCEIVGKRGDGRRPIVFTVLRSRKRIWRWLGKRREDVMPVRIVIDDKV